MHARHQNSSTLPATQYHTTGADGSVGRRPINVQVSDIVSIASPRLGGKGKGRLGGLHGFGHRSVVLVRVRKRPKAPSPRPHLGLNFRIHHSSNSC